MVDKMNDSIEVEISLTATREKRREEEEKGKDKDPIKPFPSTSQEVGINKMMEAIERLMERLTMDHSSPPINDEGKPKRDQDFRGPLPSPRNQIIPETPLQFELKDESYSESVSEEGPLCGEQT